MSINAIILGGGKLVEGRGMRSSIHKGLEKIGDIPIGERVLRALQGSTHIGDVIYCGDRLPQYTVETKNGVKNLQASSDKLFFGTLDEGFSALTNDDPVLIIAGDLPLLEAEYINGLLAPLLGTDLTGINLFYTTNPEIQTTFPKYNPNKRFAQLREGEIVFSNAFIIKKTTWMKVSAVLQTVLKNGKLDMTGLVKNIDLTILVHIFRIIAYSNIKQLHPLLVKYLRCIFRSPSLMDDLVPIFSKQFSDTITIRGAHPVFSIDYDRRSQQAFFEEHLK